MRRFPLLAANGLIAVLACAGVANAQVDSAGAIGAYPTPYNPVTAGSMVVAPPLRGSGAVYSYEQLNPGASLGMSPSTYYSQNFFGSNSVSPYAYATGYSSGYSAPVYAYPGVSTYPTQTVPATTYATVPSSNSAYANANSVYYRTRRGGPLRRLFGR